MFGRAHYLHSTVYIFLPEAYNAIVSQFHEDVANETVQCWYDESQHVFHIECPSALAGDADCILGDKIALYVSQELAAVEQEDTTHRTSIRIFREANVTTLDGAPNPMTTEMPPLIGAKLYRSHVLMIPAAEFRMPGRIKAPNPSVELHSLTDIPPQLSHRIIQPDRKAARKLIRDGRICRMVLWDEDEACYVPEDIVMTEPPQTFNRTKAQCFDLAPFHILLDGRIPVDAGAVEEADNDANTTMEWLIGVEKADILEPEAKQDMPKDTRELLIQQPRTTARARVPKGTVLLLEEEDYDDGSALQLQDENTPSLHIPLNAFAAVNEAAEEAPGRLVNDTSGMSNDESLPGLDARFSSVVSEQITTPTKTSEYPIMQDDFGTWDKGFSIVDRYGLTSDPRSAAQLDLECRRQRQLAAQSKASVSALQRLTGSQLPSTTRGCLTLSQTQHGSRAQSDSVVAPSYQNAHKPASDAAVLPPWTNRVVERTIHDFQDDSSSQINLLDDQSFPSLKWQPLQPLPAEPQRTRSGAQGMRSDHIVESLRVPDQRSIQKRDTMNQKARPKQLARKRVAARVELPLPDPIPRPRSTKRNSESPITNDKSVPPAKDVQIPQQQESIATKKGGMSKMSCRLSSGRSGACSHDFCHLLQQELTLQDPDRSRLEVHIGMAIVHATKYGSLLNGTFHFDEAEANLNSTEASVETDFLRSLTTSNFDAALIHMDWKALGDVSDESVYEIHFRRPDGNLLIMTMSHSDKVIDSVITPGLVRGEAVLHYPTHVWDAHMMLRGPVSEMSTNETLELFVASMETIGEAPSFKAMVKGAYYPVAAYAKRIFLLEDNGLTFRLSQVHDLKLQNEGNEQHNFAAYVDRTPWWEVTVESEVGKLSELKQHVDSLVTLMDHIGIGNEGIQIKKKKVDDDDEHEFKLEMYGRKLSKFVPADPNNIWW